MFRSLYSSTTRNVCNSVTRRRTFLSEAYKCTESWAARLNTPVLEKVKLDSFYFELDQKLQQQGKVSAVDVDVLANKITSESFKDELSDMVHKLRLTEETSNSLDSMGHALIRLYLDQNHIQELLDVLNDRLSYGVFLDSFTANLAMDQLIKAGNYKAAAQIATFMMLQEDFEHSITRNLALYSCWKFIDDIKPFVEQPIVATAATTTTTKTDQPVKKKKPEEVKVRVKFLRNQFFDDHFDLVDSKHLIGKTLNAIGKRIDDGSPLGNSVRIVGLTLYQKYDEALQLLPRINQNIHKEAVEFVRKTLNETTDQDGNESFQQFKTAISTLAESGELVKSDVEKEIFKLVQNAVEQFESKDIVKQKEIYAEWIKVREIKLNEEFRRLDRARRLIEIERMTKEMDTEEEKLWFFENEDKIDLQIDGNRKFYPKRWFGKKKKPRTVDAGYVPPEVRSSTTA